MLRTFLAACLRRASAPKGGTGGDACTAPPTPTPLDPRAWLKLPADSLFLFVRVDMDKNRVRVKLFLPQLSMDSDYYLQGRILMLPIQGHGHSSGNYCEDFPFPLLASCVLGVLDLGSGRVKKVQRVKKGHRYLWYLNPGPQCENGFWHRFFP